MENRCATLDVGPIVFARGRKQVVPLLVVIATSCALLRDTAAQTRAPQALRPEMAPMPELHSRHLFTMTIKLHPTEEVGNTPAGIRRVFPVAGGDFEGDRVRGSILPVAGSDLLLTRSDGSSQQDVRIVLRTDDGALVVMTYRGVRHASADVNDRIARGEQVAASEYYLRTAPFFETSSPKYGWLNKIVTIGVGERRRDGVVYEVFEIL